MLYEISLLIFFANIIIRTICQGNNIGLIIRPIEESHSAISEPEYQRKLAALPTNYDFTATFASCNPNAKNQGSCGDDYAFATSSVIELRKCRNVGSYVSLSAQDVVSCDQHNEGCGGGNGLYSFIFGERYGLRKEACSPYSDQSKSSKKEFTSSCRLNCFDLSSNSIKYFCKKGSSMTVDLTDDVKNEIYNRGPVYLIIKCYEDFYNLAAHVTPYKAASSSNNLLGSHAVTLIGWGTTGTVDYWIILNSWSTSWGNTGRAYIDKTDTLTLPTSGTYVTYCIVE